MCKIMPMNTITVPVGVGRTDLCKLLEKVEAGARVVLTSHGHQLPGAGSQSLAAHPPFQCPPQSQRQETDQYVCLDSPVLVMKNRPQTQVALGVAERRLGLLQLQIPLPHFSRIRFGAVGAFCNAHSLGWAQKRATVSRPAVRSQGISSRPHGINLCKRRCRPRRRQSETASSALHTHLNCKP